MTKATPEQVSIGGHSFSVVWVGHLDPDYRNKPKTQHFCCLCQRDIKRTIPQTAYVHFIHGGDAILALADESRYAAYSEAQPGGQDAGEMGIFPIGPECGRKLPAGFVHPPKESK